MARNSERPTKRPPADAAAPGVKRRLLAVDDLADSAELVARIAERCGYEAQFTSESTEVERLVRNWKPDVLVTDISMPQLDAIELISVLTGAGFAGSLVFVSGLESLMRQQASRLATMRGLNVLANLQKPLDVRDFRALLASANPTD